MQDLKITLVQTSLVWEDIKANLSTISKSLNHVIVGSTDLIILPEMFTTGFTMKAAQFAEKMDGEAVKWMKATAAAKQCVITGSIVIEEDGKYYNRLVWMQADGSYKTYDKRHLFRMANEQKTYTMGDKKLIVNLKGWKICLLICYDLRFPVWSRNQNNYDLLIYVANWPEIRNYPWKQLLIARAIENQCYVAGLNRVGTDGNNMNHSGDSAIMNFKGEIISNIKPFEETISTITLSYSDLQKFREIFRANMDADNFNIINS
jgi:omega-amidase